MAEVEGKPERCAAEDSLMGGPTQLRATAARVETRQLLYALALAGAVVFFALCTAVGAQVRLRLPFSPVPVTGQTFFVLLSGALLGRRLGVASQLLYGGIAVLWPVAAAGPLTATAGYIVGFVVAAYVVGLIVGESRSSWRVAGGMAAGSVVIYLLGAAWLTGLTGSPKVAVLQGVLPFLPGDVLKLLAAAAIVAGGRSMRKR